MIAPDAREPRAKKPGRITTPVRCKTYSNVPFSFHATVLARLCTGNLRLARTRTGK